MWTKDESNQKFQRKPGNADCFQDLKRQLGFYLTEILYGLQTEQDHRQDDQCQCRVCNDLNT